MCVRDKAYLTMIGWISWGTNASPFLENNTRDQYDTINTMVSFSKRDLDMSGSFFLRLEALEESL